MNEYIILFYVISFGGLYKTYRASLVTQWVKIALTNAGGKGLIPGSGRSPGEGNGNPLQYSCLRNPMGRGAWMATVCGVTKSWHDWGTEHMHKM